MASKNYLEKCCLVTYRDKSLFQNVRKILCREVLANANSVKITKCNNTSYMVNSTSHEKLIDFLRRVEHNYV